MRRKRWLAALAFVAGCTGTETSTTPPLIASVRFANGASYPILQPGERVVIEGFGFGAAPGEVRFSAQDGTTISSLIEPGNWSDRFIVTDVPDASATGVILVVPSTGDALDLNYAIVNRQPLGDISWEEQAPLPLGDGGLGAALGQDLTTGVHQTYLFTSIRDPNLDSTVVYAAFVGQSGVSPWDRRAALENRRRSVSLVVATPHLTRVTIPRLYVLGGLDSAGAATGTVSSTAIALPEATLGPMAEEPPMPRALVRPRVALGHGVLYVTGGVGTDGRANTEVFIAQIREDGALEGWFPAPALPHPRALHGMVVSGTKITVLGGVDTVTSGSGVDTLTSRSRGSTEALLSDRSGFFVSGSWSTELEVLPAGRSRFGVLPFEEAILVVGGLYAGVTTGEAETLRASLTLGSLGSFGPAISVTSISDLGGGNLFDLIGIAWYGLDGTPHGLVVGGRDFPGGLPRRGVWGF